jgi:hypothetical protein
MKIRLTFVAFLIIIFAACKKDHETANTPTKTIEELLTEKTWKADEIRVQISNNTTTYYKRGGSANTGTYDTDSLKFNPDNTGIYYYLGTQSTTTWNFINSDKSKMTLIINYSTPLTINLENINITENYFKYAQYSADGGISYLASGTRVPN